MGIPYPAPRLFSDLPPNNISFLFIQKVSCFCLHTVTYFVFCDMCIYKACELWNFCVMADFKNSSFLCIQKGPFCRRFNSGFLSFSLWSSPCFTSIGLRSQILSLEHITKYQYILPYFMWMNSRRFVPLNPWSSFLGSNKPWNLFHSFSTDIECQILEGRELVRLLLAAGANPAAEDPEHHQTALHTASMANDVELVKVIPRAFPLYSSLSSLF